MIDDPEGVPPPPASPAAGPDVALTLDRPATPGVLALLHDAGALPREAYDALVARATAPPGVASWRRFLDVLLLSLGIGLVLVGIIYFFAYNWADLGRLSKLGLLLLAGLIAAGIAARLRPDTLGSRLALLAATVLAGVLLAIQGQVYQSSADAWWLFAWWALVVLPWVFAGRFWPLWLLWFALLNLAVGMWWMTQSMAFETLFDARRFYGQLLSIAVMNGGLLSLWERFGDRLASPPPELGRWIPRLAVIGIHVPLVLAIIRLVIEDLDRRGAMFASTEPLGLAAAGLWAAATVALIAVYRDRRPDLAILAITAGAIMAVVTAVLSRMLFGNDPGGVDDFVTALRLLAIGGALLVQSALTVAWLRTEQRRASGEAAR